MWTGKASSNSWISQCRWSYTPRGSHPVSANIAATGRRNPGNSPRIAMRASAVDWTPAPRDRMTCESVISAMAAGQAASLFGQKVDERGCPGGTRDGEDGGDAVPVEHDAV